MSVPFVQPALAYASYSSYKNRFHCLKLKGTPKRLDKADLWEDVEAGLESINPINPRGNNRSIRLIPLAKTSCLRKSCNLKGYS